MNANKRLESNNKSMRPFSIGSPLLTLSLSKTTLLLDDKRELARGSLTLQGINLGEKQRTRHCYVQGFQEQEKQFLPQL